MTSQLNVALILKLRGALMYLTYFFDMLSMGVGKTRHWQTSGRLVQELKACIVGTCVDIDPPSNLCNVHVFSSVHSEGIGLQWISKIQEQNGICKQLHMGI